ncbi:MAG TPA: 4Fe-4S binding protein [Firmicutes bacterium]|nr:4Fe-4S binding protein [Bacillota bacterium]
MKTAVLGRTGIEVTEFCLGALPMGPTQADLSLDAASELIRTALNEGINFIDTAESYKTYPHIRQALKGFEGKAIIATKSPASSYEDMERSVRAALDELQVPNIDIFHLHAPRATRTVFVERAGALQCLIDYKKKGKIRSVGISTHVVETVYAALERRDIDVIFPLINKTGMGIIGGTVEDMARAIRAAAEAGKGVYAMKALAGGHLIDDVEGALNFVRNLPGVMSVAVGVVSVQELEYDLRVFRGQTVPDHLKAACKRETKKLVIIQTVCRGCGTCVKTCPNGALYLEGGKVSVDRERCILCGYCNPVCPEFALRLA